MRIKNILWGASFWLATAVAAAACSEYRVSDCPPNPIPAVIKFRLSHGIQCLS